MAFIFAKYRKYFAVLLLLLTGLLIENIAFNRHLHIYKGCIISHAHPYNKNGTNSSPVKTHHHTDGEFILLDQITNFQVLAGITIFLTAMLILIREIRFVPAVLLFVLPLHLLLKNRAPPKSA